MNGLSDGTCHQYALRIQDFLQHLTKPLEEYTALDIQYYLYSYQKRSGVKNRTLNTIRGEIATFFRWLASKQYIDRDPTIGMKKIKYQAAPRVPLSDDELVQLKNACKSARDKLLVSLLYETGCRVSEVTHIKLADVDMGHKSITVTGKGNKTRTVFFQANTKYLIEEYLKARRNPDSPYLFTSNHTAKEIGPLSKDSLEREMRILCKDAGLEVHCTPHTLRHTYATDMLKRGADITHIQKLLGHSSVDTTMIYADVSMDDCEADYRKRIS